MYRRQFLKITAAALTAAAADSYFLKMPLLSKQKRVAPVYYCAQVFDSEKENLSKFCTFKYDENKQKYKELMKRAASAYEKSGKTLSISPAGIADALVFFSRFFYKTSKFSESPKIDSLNASIELLQSDCSTSVYFFADFLLSIGMKKPHIQAARIAADSRYAAGHVMLKLGDLYFNTTLSENESGGLTIVSYTEDMIRQNGYSGPITLYSLDDPRIILNIDGFSYSLSQESRVWLKRLLANKVQYLQTGIDIFREAYSDSLNHFMEINRHALAVLEKLVFEHPDDAMLHYDYGYFLYEKCLYVRELAPERTPDDIYLAISHFSKAIGIFDQDWPAYLMRAECFLLAGFGEKCKADMQKAISIMPDCERKEEAMARYNSMLNEIK